MPIEALPESTSRVIGSTLALNDARSVVKELIDNALDARATTINVEISQNTLDVIQVKDNGIGIGVEDRQLLCKRGYTSKIRSLEDLSRLGGSFLGFRGEALASIAELSNVVNVTTRVDGEIAGTALSFGSSRMLSSSSASHPVGTTFRVQNFLHNIPVRKQTALKSSAKTLQSIKALIFSFAFARPKVRFSLKVLKAKSEKGNWTYAPSPKDALTEVASKIVGQDISLQCACHSVSSDGADGTVRKGWAVEALLASAGADVSKIRNATQYISIDGRPVTSDRGIVKEIVKLYKRYLRGAKDFLESQSISRPFLYLQIKCPPESYDVNVEPAKDGVLFFRPTELLSTLEKLFERAYPVRKSNEWDSQPSIEVSPACQSSNMQDCRDSLTDELNNVASNESLPAALNDLSQDDDELLSNIATSNPFTIAAMTARVLPKRMSITGTSPDTRLGERSKSPSNEEHPPNLETGRRAHRTPLNPRAQSPSTIAASDDAIPYQNPGPPLRHRTKGATRQHAEQGDGARHFGSANGRRSPDQGTLLQAWLTPMTEERRPCAQRREPQITPSRAQGAEDINDRREQPLPNNDNVFHTSVESTSSLNWGPRQKSFRSPLKRSSNDRNPVGMAMPLTSTPQDRSGHVSFPTASDTSLATDRLGEPGTVLNTTFPSNFKRPGHLFREPSMSGESTPGSELDDILDFEYRKKAAIAQQRRSASKFPSRSINDILKSRGAEVSPLSVRQPGAYPTPTGDKAVGVLDEGDFAARFGTPDTTCSKKTNPNPHHNRYLAAVKDLSHSHTRSLGTNQGDTSCASSHDEVSLPSPQERSLKIPLPENDPRAYFMRQRERRGNSRVYRTQSLKLPLESIPPDTMTLQLVHTVDGFRDPRDIHTMVERLANHDRYLVDGRNFCAELATGSSMPSHYREKILELMKKAYHGEEGESLGMRIYDDAFDVCLSTTCD